MTRKPTTSDATALVTAGKNVSRPTSSHDAGNVTESALIEKASKALAAEIAHHIETMYPDAAKAVAWESCKRSLSGLTQNTMKRLGDAAEAGKMDQTIKDMTAHRREINRLRKIGEMADAARKRAEQEQANATSHATSALEDDRRSSSFAKGRE